MENLEIKDLKNENRNLKNKIKNMIDQLKIIYELLNNKNNIENDYTSDTDYSSSEEDQEWSPNTNY